MNPHLTAALARLNERRGVHWGSKVQAVAERDLASKTRKAIDGLTEAFELELKDDGQVYLVKPGSAIDADAATVSPRSAGSPAGHLPDPSDLDWREVTVTAVRDEAESWSITCSDGWSFYVPTDPVKPAEGETARFYGEGFGYVVRGLTIGGRVYFYRTAAEQEVYAEELTYGKDAAEMLARWDRGDGIWTVEMGGFSPGYEQALQLAAMEFLRAFLRHKPDPDALDPKLRAVVDKEVEAVTAPLGLSGAQWGAASALGFRFYAHGPAKTVKAFHDDRRMQCSRAFPTLAVLA